MAPTASSSKAPAKAPTKAPPPSHSLPSTSSHPTTSPSLSSLSATPTALRKFSLHPPSLLTPSSILMTVANSTIPLTPNQLTSLRTVLTSAKVQAQERLNIRDSNKKNLSERQVNEKKFADEQARLKEMERRRKREEDEKREKDRLERIEKDKLEKERELIERRRKEEEEFMKVKRKEEEEKIKEDEEKRIAAVQRARELKEKEKKKAEDMALALAATKAAEATALAAKAAASAASEAAADLKEREDKARRQIEEAREVDVKMEDVSSEVVGIANGSNSEAAPNKAVSAVTQVPAIMVESSPDLEDEDMIGQPRPPARDGKKKKRKRDQVVDSDASSHDSDSDTQPLIQKVRKLEAKGSSASVTGSPSPAAGPSKLAIEQKVPDTPTDPDEGLTPIERKLKEDKFVKHSIPIRPPAPGTATAFYLPSQSLVPSRPISIPPISTPKKQSEVSGDFSNAKPGAQIAHHTFHTWADAYLRPFGEDDLAFLAPKPDDLTPYFIPPLGKHYTEQWEEEDNDLPPSNTSNYISPLEFPHLNRVKPENLNEDSLGSENVSLGPLSERLVAALAFQNGFAGDDSNFEDDDDDVDEDEDEAEGEEVDPGARNRALDAVELEDRIKKELRFIGLLPEEDIDWSMREDDEISSALRACQRQLHRQTTLNEARKLVLTGIVKDRMAYQDYETTRDAQERIIENGWLKRQKTQVKKKGKPKDKDKNKKDQADKEGGDGTLENGKAPLALSLIQAVEKRHVLVESFRPFFEEEPQGRFWGIPERSVYEGLVEETPDGRLIGELVD